MFAFYPAYDARYGTSRTSRHLYAWSLHAANAVSSGDAPSWWVPSPIPASDRAEFSVGIAMYSPGMGQMPREFSLPIVGVVRLLTNGLKAPTAYMPPPPGPYPPPNGAGPRPSMPPTPIPAHAHPYYHQSPQRMIPFDQFTFKMFSMPTYTVQHAVPYHMMMPPPPNVPQHPYEGGPAPPVQMGGHA
jgi:hypothetical protein